MGPSLHILIVDDSEDDALLLQHVLRRGGYQIDCVVVSTPEAMQAALESRPWDLITSDHAMPHFTAPAALALAKRLRPNTPFLIVSGEINLNLAVALMRGGAQDYIHKSELARLLPAIERVMVENKVRLEREWMNAALIESSERLREVLENSQDASYKRNLITNTYEYLSPAITAITGYTVEELVVMPDETFFAHVHPDEAAEAHRVLNATNFEPVGEPYQADYRFRGKDGVYRWVQDRFTVIRGANGEPLARIGSVRDISKRKCAENALNTERLRLDSILKGTNSGTWEWNVQTGETIFNQRWAEMIGYSLEDLAPVSIETWRRLAHPADLPHSDELLQRHFHGETAYYECEARMRHKDGSWVWIIDRGKVISWTEDGRPLWMMGTHQDITAWRAAEDARRLSEERFTIAFRTSPDSININRLSDGLYIEINDGFTQMTGYTTEDVQGKTSLELNIWVDPADRERLVKGLREHGQVTNLEADFRCKNGEIKTCLMSARIIELNGEKCLLSITRDIRERKQAENEIRRLNADLEQRVASRTVQLEAANQELEAFAYSVSHDLRAPLRALEGFATILTEDYAGALDEEGRHYVNRIQEASRRMDRLVNDLLSLSRINRRDLTREPVDMSAMAEQIAADLRAQQPERPVEFHIAPGMTAQADSSLVHIVLENLLNNAFKFTANTPRAVISMSMRMEENHAVFSVRDNGTGFDMTRASRLFAPFQRLHSEREFPGHGIGLATVKRIVTRHGGRIWAEGQVGQGAEFSFTLD
jgi:PAS domain S-box-containing protein